MEQFPQDYPAASPFPHVVFDDFLPEERVRAIAGEVANLTVPSEPRFYGTRLKGRLSDMDAMGPATRELILELNAPPFVQWLEKLTGMNGLVADPGLQGGGVHQIGRGGFLKIHTDFNWHKGLRLHRRLNLILYLNEPWQEEWGGYLELWKRDMSACVRRIAPLLNRIVIFSTTDESYHGHPEALACPEGVTRNSIALYYYSKERPASEVRFGASGITNYRPRHSDYFGLKHKVHQALIRNPILRRILDV